MNFSGPKTISITPVSVGLEAVTSYISGEGEGVGADPSEPLNTCTIAINKCLEHPKDESGKQVTIHLVSGAFGCCNKMFYRGIPVAVKTLYSATADEVNQWLLQATSWHVVIIV